MSVWSKFGSILKVVGVDAEKVAIVAAPVAASAFGGPGAGTLVQSIIDSLHGMASAGVSPNKQLLTSSIGQIIEGTIGVLQATGKIPMLDTTLKATLPITTLPPSPPTFPSTKV